MPSKEMTPTKKRFSLTSSASQSRPRVHFDNEAVFSHPEIIDSSRKKRLLIPASHPSPYKSSPSRDDHEHEDRRPRRQSIVLSPTKLSFAASYPKIQPTEENDDSSHSRRRSMASHPSPKSFPRDEDYGHESRPGRRPIVLSPTTLSFSASYPKIDSMQKNDHSRTRRRSVVTPPTTELLHPDPALKQKISSHPSHKSSPRRDDHDHEAHRHRRQSIVLSPTRRSFTVSTTGVHQMDALSPRKRRISTTSPLHDPVYDSTSHHKRRPSISSEQDPPASFIRSRILFTIPPSINLPPPQVCTEINQRVKSTFYYPDFDFIQHIQHRSYVVRTQYFKESECVFMLDTGVDNLLQRKFEKLPPQPDTNFNIDIKSSPGKGLGMFSRKQISNGVAFLVEYPTVITPYVIGLSVGLSTLYADIFKRLSGPTYGELMNLSYFPGKTKDVCEDIMRINALAIELPVPGGQYSELNTHRAIFLQTSRCNHSCDPNARWEWDSNRFCLVLTATRNIEKGEEITIPYVAPNITNQERQNILSRFYGFTCSCPFCIQLPKDNIRPTDLSCSTVPSKLKFEESALSSSVLPSFENWCLDPTFPDDILINAHLHSLQDLKRTDHSTRDTIRHLDAIAMCYGALEDADNFRIWMGHVAEARLRNSNNMHHHDHDHDHHKPAQHKLVFNKWISNPTSFPVWGWRRVFCGDHNLGRDENTDSGLWACVSMGMFDWGL